MSKDFKAMRYVVDENIVDTLTWLLAHQDCFESFEYDAMSATLLVHHANGTDQIKQGDYLTAQYGILITSL